MPEAFKSQLLAEHKRTIKNGETSVLLVRIKIKEIVKTPRPAHCPGGFMLSSRLVVSLAAFSGFQQPPMVSSGSLVPVSSLARHLLPALSS